MLLTNELRLGFVSWLVGVTDGIACARVPESSLRNISHRGLRVQLRYRRRYELYRSYGSF
jgi:hypothetical protein